MLPQDECTGEGGGAFGKAPAVVATEAADGGDTEEPAVPAPAPAADAPVPAATESVEDKALKQRARAAIERSKVAVAALVASEGMSQEEADAIIQSCVAAANAVM